LKRVREVSVVAAIIIIVVILGAVLYSSFQYSKTSQSSCCETSTDTSLGGSSGNSSAAYTSVTNSSDHLRFSLQLSYNDNGSLTIKVDEFNLLDSPNDVTATNGWAYPSNSLDPFNNCPIFLLDGFAVASGHYEMNNLSEANPLRLYNAESGQLSCSSDSYPNEYEFQPLSDRVSNYGVPALSEAITGYYSQSGSSFISFPSGVYTVIGADQWGNVLLLYFTASPSGLSPFTGASNTTTTMTTTVTTTSPTQIFQQDQ